MIKLSPLLLLLCLIVGSAYFPLHYQYLYPAPPLTELPEHVTYQQAIIEQLARKIQQKAAKNGCQGGIIPLSGFRTDDPDLGGLETDINLALATYEPWHLLTKPAQKRLMEQRMRKNIQRGYYDKYRAKQWTQDTIHLIQQTKYRAFAQWRYLENKQRVQVDVKVLHEIGTELFFVRVEFTHPHTIKQWQQSINQLSTTHTALAKQAQWGTYFALGFSGLFLLYLIVLGWVYYYRKKTLATDFSQFEQLVAHGHFVTALEKANTHLAYFPNHTGLLTFKRLLLNMTEHNPEDAEKIYLKAQKFRVELQARLDQAHHNPSQPLLGQDEKQQLLPMLALHPELKNTYQQLTQMEGQLLSANQFADLSAMFSRSLQSGNFDSAKQQLQQLQRQYPQAPELIDFSDDLTHRLQKAENSFNELQQQLAEGDIVGVLEELAQLIQQYPDWDTPTTLQQQLDQAKGICPFQFQRNGQVLWRVYCQDSLVFGRLSEDGQQADVQFENKSISRQHLRLTIVDNGVVVEDLSTYGTSINGERISVSKLHSGDSVILANNLELDVTLQQQNQQLHSVVFSDSKQTIIWLIKQLEFDLTPALACNQGGSHQLYSQQQRVLLKTPQGLTLLTKGDKVQLAGLTYEVNQP